MALQSTPRPLVFVDDEYQANRQKKRAASRACGDCRRKKKRCEHGESSSDVFLHDSSKPQGQDDVGGHRSTKLAALADQRPPQDGTHEASEADGGTEVLTPATGIIQHITDETSPMSDQQISHTSQGPDKSYPRFVGDLNPEAELLSDAGPGVDKPAHNSVGVWQPEHPERSIDDKGDTPSSSAGLLQHCPPLARRLLTTTIEEQCMAVRPHAALESAMCDFYHGSIHPILPCVDWDTYTTSWPGSPLHALLVQTICLAVHVNPVFSNRLVLSGSDSVLSPTDFSLKILGAMRLNIELALTSDKAILIRVLATMSMFAHARETPELPSQFLARSVALAHTIGLHQKLDTNAEGQRLDGLFCYIWAVDKLHAAMHGRPVTIHERDLSLTPEQRLALQPPGQQMFVRIAVLLDRVIALYRPHFFLEAIPGYEFPSFEDLLIKCEALELLPHLLESVKPLYHAVAILSCRSRSRELGSISSAHDARQGFSALEIMDIAEERAGVRLVIFPWTPYAVSLALSTACRQVRRSTLLPQRIRARRRVVRGYRLLQKMSSVFWSAALMAELARKTLNGTEDLTMTDSSHEKGIENMALATKNNSSPSCERWPAKPNQPWPNGNPEVEAESHRQTAQDTSFQTEDLGMMNFDEFDWNTEDIAGFLEGNLDLSMPTFPPEIWSKLF